MRSIAYIGSLDPILVSKHKCVSDLAGVGFQYNVISVNRYTFFHNILCRSGAILNRIVISGVYDIFVRNNWIRQIHTTGPWYLYSYDAKLFSIIR